MATLTLAPTRAGDVTGLSLGAGDSNWQAQLTNDGDTSYVYALTSELYDLYALANHTTETGAITNVAVVCVSRHPGGGGAVKLKIKTGGTEYTSAEQASTESYAAYTGNWATNPKTGVAWTWDDIDALQAGCALYGFASARSTQLYVVVTWFDPPTVTTQAVSGVAYNAVTGNGNITATGGANATRRGFCYKEGTSGDPTTSDSVAYDDGSFGTGAYTKAITGLSPNTSYRVRAYATSPGGTGYGTTVQAKTAPAAPANVEATRDQPDTITVTWDKSTGATDYQVYRDGAPVSAWLGDVDEWEDTETAFADAGESKASAGKYAGYVQLEIEGLELSNDEKAYTVVARSSAGDSPESAAATGNFYGSYASYQWQRSFGEADYTYRIPVTIDHTKIDELLTHFPVMLRVTEPAVFAELGAEKLKLAVMAADDKTQLYVEIEKWDEVGEEAILWVSRSDWEISDTEDTILYLYYDSTHADNTGYVGVPGSAAAEAVWDANHVMVQHMNDGVDTSHITDSTTNDNDGTKKGAGEPLEADGVIGKAQDYDATDDVITVADKAAIQNIFDGGGTIEILVDFDSDGENDQGYIIVKGNVSWSIYVFGESVGLLRLGFFFNFDGAADGSWITTAGQSVVPVGSSCHIVISYNANDVANNPTFIIDGVTKTVGAGITESTTPIGTRVTDAGSNLLVGNSPAGTRTVDGIIEEVRVSDTARSAAWIKAGYYNCSDLLCSFGAADENYSNITGAIHAEYQDWDAPASPARRYYRCYLTFGTASDYSAAARGYRKSAAAPSASSNIVIKNPDGETLAYAKDAWGMNTEERINELGTLKFNISADNAAAEHLEYPNEAWLYTHGDFVDRYKITNPAGIRSGGAASWEVGCQHVGEVLTRDIIVSYTKALTDACDVTAILTDLLGYQEVARITLGTVSAALDSIIAVEIAGLDIWAAVKTVRDTVGGYLVFAYDPDDPMTVTLSLLDTIGGSTGQQIRVGKNLTGMTYRRDYIDYCNRLYPIGSSINLSAKEYERVSGLQSADATYGYIRLVGLYSAYKDWSGEGDALPANVTVEGPTGAWESPSGVSSSTGWTNPAYGHDDNPATQAIYYIWPHEQWTEWLSFSLAATAVTHVKWLIAYRFRDNFFIAPTVQVDIYYSSAWHTVFYGSPAGAHDEWAVCAFPEQTITGVRFREWNPQYLGLPYSQNPSCGFTDIYVWDSTGWDDVTVNWKQGADENTLRAPIASYDEDVAYVISYTHADYLIDLENVTERADIRSKAVKFNTSDADALLEMGRIKLTEIKEPRVAMDIEAIDLSVQEGREFEEPALGNTVTVIDEELDVEETQLIMRLNKPDLQHPGLMDIDVANKTQDIIDTI
jgi:hypothetical protein